MSNALYSLWQCDVVKAWQYENASFPMLFTPCGSVMLVKLWQLKNTLSQITHSLSHRVCFQFAISFQQSQSILTIGYAILITAPSSISSSVTCLDNFPSSTTFTSSHFLARSNFIQIDQRVAQFPFGVSQKEEGVEAGKFRVCEEGEEFAEEGAGGKVAVVGGREEQTVGGTVAPQRGRKAKGFEGKQDGDKGKSSMWSLKHSGVRSGWRKCAPIRGRMFPSWQAQHAVVIYENKVPSGRTRMLSGFKSPWAKGCERSQKPVG